MKADYKKYFKGKKVVVMGLDPNGRGLPDATFLAKAGAIVIGTDLRQAKELPGAVALAKKYKNFKLRLGEHRLADFAEADLVIRPASAPPGSPYIAEAVKNNVPIVSDETLFLHLAPKITTVGVTGTRGKSTVACLIYEILKRDGRRVWLGGNVQKTSLLPFLEKVQAGDIVVMELDSWKLQSFGDNKLSPNIAVFTNLMVDHQNYYKDNMAAYFADKANIYRYQTTEDVLITDQATKSLITKNKFPAKAEKVIVKAGDMPSAWKTKLLGEHNKLNIAYAVAAARVLGVTESVIKKAVESFVGLPGRMELVREVGGVKFYNDTNGTTPDAVLAALESLSKYHGKIILLGGGADKNLDYSQYLKAVPKAVKALILFKGAATEKIIAGLPKKGGLPVFVVESMAAAISLAAEQMQKGDIVLLSPAAASFGVFKNEYDRGDQFVKLVKKLK